MLSCQVEVLQEEVTYATDEVEKLTKVLDEQRSLLQASQEQVAKKNDMIHKLEKKVSTSPQQNRPIILRFIFNAVSNQRLFCTSSKNNTMLLNKQSEMEVWNLLLSRWSHLNHYLE